MAFAFNNAPASNNAQGNNEGWKAKAFLNLWIRRADGSRMKIGAIALRDQKITEKALIERLQKDDGVPALLQALEIDFQLANKDTESVNLGF